MKIILWTAVACFFISACDSEDDVSPVANGGLNANTIRPTTQLSGEPEIIEYNPEDGFQSTFNLEGNTINLEIPPNLLDTADQVTISVDLIIQIDNLPEGVAPVMAFHFEPAGFTFLEPAKITIKPAINLNLTTLSAFQFSNGTFRFMPVVENSAGSFTFLISHFSDIGLIDGVSEILEIDNPQTSDDFINNLAAAQKKAIELLESIFEQWKEAILRPRLEIDDKLEDLEWTIVEELKFIANKQMLGVESNNDELKEVQDLMLKGIGLLETECQNSECKKYVLKTALHWLANAQSVGISDQDFPAVSIPNFCNGIIQDFYSSIELSQTGALQIPEGQTVSIAVELFNDIIVGERTPIQSSSAYGTLKLFNTNPAAATAEIDAASRSLNITGEFLGSTTITITDPCGESIHNIEVEVVEEQTYMGSISLTCTESGTTSVGGEFTTEKVWDLTITADIGLDDFNQTSIVTTSIEGSASIETTVCLAGNCDTNTDDFTIMHDGTVGTGNALNTTRYNLGNIFGKATLIDFIYDEIEDNQISGRVVVLGHIGCEGENDGIPLTLVRQ